MSDRRRMDPFDWISAAFVVALGVMFGILADNLARLSAATFWPVLIFSVASVFGVLAIDRAVSWLSERVFPSGIRTVRSPKPEGRRPLGLLLSLPAGVALGVVLAALGYDRAILGLT
ncbi:MAG: hypothetical protein RIB61_09130 [Roseicyclus sp.]